MKQKYVFTNHRNHGGVPFSIRTLQLMVLTCGIGCAVGGWYLREVSNSRTNAQDSACRSNLSYIGLALRNYHELFGCFPPAYTIDQEGRPSCSWRVLLLAADPAYSYIYSAYKPDEPWNSPSNRKLASEIPSFYRCLNDQSQKSNWPFTSYVAIAGRETGFQGSQPIKLADIKGYRDQTILIAEVANSGINWMEPRDLDVSQLSFVLNDPNRPSISSRDPGGPGVVFMNGKHRRLTKLVSPAELKSMTTVDRVDAGIHLP